MVSLRYSFTTYFLILCLTECLGLDNSNNIQLVNKTKAVDKAQPVDKTKAVDKAQAVNETRAVKETVKSDKAGSVKKKQVIVGEAHAVNKTQAASNMTQAVSNMTQDASNTTQAVFNRTQSASNMTQNASNTTQAASNMTQAVSNRTQTASNMTQAASINTTQAASNMTHALLEIKGRYGDDTRAFRQTVWCYCRSVENTYGVARLPCEKIRQLLDKGAQDKVNQVFESYGVPVCESGTKSDLAELYVRCTQPDNFNNYQPSVCSPCSYSSPCSQYDDYDFDNDDGCGCNETPCGSSQFKKRKTVF